jgi:hypothetical protein
MGVNLILDFFSNDRQILGSFHANPHNALSYPNHRYGDIISYKNFLTDFSRKDKHDLHRSKNCTKAIKMPVVIQAKLLTLSGHRKNKIAMPAFLYNSP